MNPFCEAGFSLGSVPLSVSLAVSEAGTLNGTLIVTSGDFEGVVGRGIDAGKATAAAEVGRRLAVRASESPARGEDMFGAGGDACAMQTELAVWAVRVPSDEQL